jgi:hypothetical protein
VDNFTLIKENYGKSSGAAFIAKGRCKALFRGREHFDFNIINPIKAKLEKKKIRVFDIILYKEIEIQDAILIQNWEQELIKFNDQPNFTVQFEDEAAIHFATMQWENVDFIRTEIELGILVNPNIIYAYQEGGYTFGEIEGELIFKVHNPKIEPLQIPVKSDEVIETSNVFYAKSKVFNPLTQLLPESISSSDIPLWKNTGCIWPILRFFILLLLGLLLIKSCSQFSSAVWNQEKENKIKNDSTLRIPDGDEKEFKDRNKKFIIDKDTTLTIPPGSYKLLIRDHGTKVDHDKINVIFNGQVFKRNMEVFSNPTEIPLTNLKYGENYIDFAVVSQGDSGNCTAEIIFINTIDNTFTAKIKVNNIINHISRLKLIQR